MTDFDLADRVVIVTGGGQGIGRAYCHAFGEQGAAVVVADLAGENAERVAKEVTAQGGRALAVEVNVADEAAVNAMAAATIDAFGPPTVLINNAAIFSTLSLKPFTEISLAEWNRVMAVNVDGAFLCCRAVVPAMTEVGYGKIINVSSSTVFLGRPNYLHYVTSKMAIVGMTRALANEVGQYGIRVNCLTPGATETEIERETVTKEQFKVIAGMTALRTVQTPKDLVGAVLYLSSPHSDFITGQTLNVDGGQAFH
jgi:3-oxoacyl-[acyl-carrier protein] reductase